MRLLIAMVLALALLPASASAALPTICPEWTEAQNPYKEGHEETLSTIPLVSATSTEKGLYEAHLTVSDYEFATYNSLPYEVWTVTWALSYPHESYTERLTTYTGINYQGEATLRLTGLHAGPWETVLTAYYPSPGLGPSFNWIPFKQEPATASSCVTLGGVGGAVVQ